MIDKLHFVIVSGDVDPHTGVKSAYNRTAETDFQQLGPSITWIACETLAPLLDPRISSAERMLCHFKLGVTLVHEFCVSNFSSRLLKVVSRLQLYGYLRICGQLYRAI